MPNKTADGIRRALQTVSLLAVASLVFVGLTTAARRLSHHAVGAAEVIGLVLVAAILLGGVAARFARRVRKATVIELDLASLPAEADDLSLTALLGPRKLTMRELVDALGRAAADKRVAGLLIHTTFAQAGLAQVQDIRDAISGLRAAGKFAVAYCDEYNNASYYLATSCDEILLQPTGGVGLAGLARTPNFYKGAMDKLGVEFQAEGRWEYKSAADQITRTRMSRPFKESTQRLLDSSFGQIVAGVMARTGQTEKAVRALVDRGPFLAGEALDEGLVDTLLYRDQAIDRVKTKAGVKSSLLDLTVYNRRAKRAPGKGRPTTIAVITATGAIVSRRQGVDPIAGRTPMESDKVSAEIRKAVKDKRVKSIVLRVDSPGGSAIASEAIWRETVVAKEQNKPVVVSMGNVAASGGYYIAAAADRIVAQPGTITGSIGVISGKPLVAKAKRKLAIHAEELKTSAHAAMQSVNRPFQATELERFQAGLDDVYETFTSRVAQGRGLALEEVHTVARGRVWTGEDAHARGLVDELGGLTTAIRLAVELAGGKAGAPVKVVAFPKKQSPVSRVRAQKPQSSDDIAALASMLSAVVGPVRRLVAELGLVDRGALHCGLTDDDWLVR